LGKHDRHKLLCHRGGAVGATIEGAIPRRGRGPPVIGHDDVEGLRGSDGGRKRMRRRGVVGGEGEAEGEEGGGGEGNR